MNVDFPDDMVELHARPKIQNVSMLDVELGLHIPAQVLIRIVDPAYEPEPPKHKFDSEVVFEFLDLDSDEGELGQWAITDEQAAEIVAALKHCASNGLNVVVHCMAGLCRSGAVAEVGVAMGFDDAGKTRIPNVLVKRKLMNALGWGYRDV